jgi:hypothetical protein
MAVRQHPAASEPPATCSGDPANCMACADDSFGQAFCTAVGESVSTTSACDDCPCRVDAARSGSSCSEPAGCSSLEHGASSAPDTIPTNDAWRQLKSHPNVAFADLSLLAEVVARRSKCTGPRVVISPALGAATPERVNSPPCPEQADANKRSVFLTDLHALDSMDGSPPRLVPQEFLIECGRQKVREVRADAVREALRLLDAKFS